MANSKLRCRGCKEYRPRDDFFVKGFCSKACLDDSRRTRAPKRQVTASAASSSAGTRAEIRARDKGRCRLCGTSRNLHVHHVTYRSQGGTDHESNLVTLCNEHHAIVHMNPSRYQPLLRAYLWLLYVERQQLSLLQIERWLASRV